MTVWLNPHRGPGNTPQEAEKELGGQGGKLSNLGIPPKEAL